MSELCKLLVFHILLLEMFPSHHHSFPDTTGIYYASWPHKGSVTDGCTELLPECITVVVFISNLSS